MRPDFSIKQGDTAPAIGGVLVDDDGNAVDINGADLVFSLRSIEGGTAVVDRATASNAQNGDAATATSNGTKGAWSYSWAPANTDAPGYYNAEVEVTYSGGAVETFPNDGYLVVKITEAID